MATDLNPSFDPAVIEAGRERRQHVGEDERQRHEHLGLDRVGRLRVQFLLQEHRHAHDQRPDADGEKVRHLAYGHAGDGNLHVNFLWDDPDEAPRVDRAIEGLMRATVALGGTISGEHGIGLAKVPYPPLEQGPELIGLQQNLKAVFDPKGLLNPGKIFPSRGHGGC